MRFVAMLFAMACLASPAIAGPFGIEKGQSIKSLKIIRKGEDPGVYAISVPLPNAEFVTYGVLATAEDGVCSIWGIGRSYQFDNEGKDVRKAFAALRERLNIKYGIGKIEDHFSGSPGTDLSFTWLLAIKQEDRVYRSTWGQQPSVGIKSIMLDVEAASSVESNLALIYDFDNIDACNAHMPQKNTDGL